MNRNMHRTRIPPPLKSVAPIERWDEAVPLGNGLIGLLVWGEKNIVRLSLDRGDLWDLRHPPGMQSPAFTAANLTQWIGEENHRAIRKTFSETSHRHCYPTKLPAGRIELRIRGAKVTRFDLCFADGVCTVHFDNGGSLAVCVPPDGEGFILRTDGVCVTARIVPPQRSVKEHSNGQMGFLTLDNLGYPPPRTGHGWMVQETAGNAFSICLRQKGQDRAVSLAQHPSDALAKARKGAEELLNSGFSAATRASRRWWRAHWAASAVDVPDRTIQSAYDFAQYTYGACARRGFPPMPLQGLWTADDGTLPPWRGDYTNDLNTQMSYWAALPANRLDSDRAMLEFFWELLPTHRALARRIWDAPGAWVPGAMALDGLHLGGWTPYAMAATVGAWIAWHFHRHWKFTGDPVFLRDRALPYATAIGEFLLGVLKCDPKGGLVLPFSASPEIHDDRPEAWLNPPSNYDLALMRRLFVDLTEMDPRNRKWRETLARLPQLAVSVQAWEDLSVRPGQGPLLLAPGEELAESHRHHSHLMAIHPLGLLSCDRSEEKEIIDQSLRQLERLGTGLWVGYSFAWAACLYARAGHAAAACHHLRLFCNTTCTRNGFHVNGDFKRTGATAWHYRPFTLEGNFAAAEAVHEMLLQSQDGVLRVFPALPPEWENVHFDNLRAAGGWLVSARRQGGRLTSLRIQAPPGGGGKLRLRKCEEGLRWNRPVRSVGSDWIFTLPGGAELTGT